MKKIILIILVVICFIVLSNNEVNITEDAIRFRVIANSNASNDIIMKEKVVQELSKTLFKKASNKDDAREEILSNIETVQEQIDNLFSINNYNKNYNISYGYNYFPEKKYKGQKFEEGNYESLVIEIGEGKGNNYWCVLYPPLCMVDDNFDDDVEYNLKIVELFKKIF